MYLLKPDSNEQQRLRDYAHGNLLQEMVEQFGCRIALHFHHHMKPRPGSRLIRTMLDRKWNLGCRNCR